MSLRLREGVFSVLGPSPSVTPLTWGGEGLSPFPFLSRSGSSLVLQVKFTCYLFPHLLRLLFQKGMEVPVAFAPPAVSAHPLHLHHGRLSQEPLNLVCEHPVEFVQKKPVIVCGPPVPMPWAWVNHGLLPSPTPPICQPHS